MASQGHVGATGTVAWADPERDLCCAILTNEMVEDGALLKRVSNAVVAAVDVLELEPPVGGLPPWSPRL